MANYDIRFRDPGGEQYFSKGLSVPGVWTGGFTTASIVNNAPAGRATQYAIQLGNNGVVKRNTDQFASWIVGVAWYFGTANNNENFLVFQDTVTGNPQLTFQIGANGAITALRGSSTSLGTSTNLLTFNTWNYIEVKVVIASGTSGSVEVRVNGVAWLTLTGINTQNTANAFSTQIWIETTAAANVSYIKDIYMMADTGTGPYTTYLGDVTVLVSFHNVAGTNQQWTPNTGTQTAAVQDGITHTGTWPDDDTTYISDNTVGHISDFAHQTLSLTGQIYEVCHVSYMRKDDAGSRGVAQVTIQSASVIETSSTISLGNTYQYYYDSMEVDPGTSLQWTVSGYNNSTFGVKTIS